MSVKSILSLVILILFSVSCEEHKMNSEGDLTSNMTDFQIEQALAAEEEFVIINSDQVSKQISPYVATLSQSAKPLGAYTAPMPSASGSFF